MATCKLRWHQFPVQCDSRLMSRATLLCIWRMIGNFRPMEMATAPPSVPGIILYRESHCTGNHTVPGITYADITPEITGVQ